MTDRNPPALDAEPPADFHAEAEAAAPAAETAAPVSPRPLPNPNRRLGRTGPVWIALLIVLAVAVILIFAMRGGQRQPATPAIQVTGGAPGGLILPTQEAAPTLTPAPPTPTPIPLLQPGQRVRIANTAGEGIRLRADASTNSITYEIYNDGALFTVVEPSSDYDSYPVEAQGYRWYRVQAEDGLVGWTVFDFLEAID